MVMITVRATGKIKGTDELREQILDKKVIIFYADRRLFLSPRKVLEVLEVSEAKGERCRGMFKVVVENISTPFYVSPGSRIEVYESYF